MNNNEIVNNLRTIASFLHENEQYGDDWSNEIATLDYLIGKFDGAED